MKLTNAQLKQIIKEEMNKVLREMGDYSQPTIYHAKYESPIGVHDPKSLEELKTELESQGFEVIKQETYLQVDGIDISSVDGGFQITDRDYPDQSREISKSVEEAIEDIKLIKAERGY